MVLQAGPLAERPDLVGPAVPDPHMVSSSRAVPAIAAVLSSPHHCASNCISALGDLIRACTRQDKQRRADSDPSTRTDHRPSTTDLRATDGELRRACEPRLRLAWGNAHRRGVVGDAGRMHERNGQ